MLDRAPIRARFRPGRRAVVAAVAVVALAFALAGCVNVNGTTGIQQNTFGRVAVGATLCASGSTSCAGNGNSDIGAVTSDTDVLTQLLVAYRVPAGSDAPDTLRFFDDDGLGPLFTRDAGYTAELQRLAPAPAGQQWFGYLSTAFTYNGMSTVKSAPILTSFGLPAVNGAPFAGPFTRRVVVGFRLVSADLPATRPVRCGIGLTTTNNDELSICADSPSGSDIVTSIDSTIRDLGVKAPGAQTVAPGQTASLPFTLRFSGAISATPEFALSAATTVPGASPQLTPASVAPTTTDPTPATVTVPVPAGTAPGTYSVTLTATLGTVTRQGVASIVVPAPTAGGSGGGPVLRPTLSGLTISPRSISRGRRAAPATLKVTLGQAGTLKVAVARSAKGLRRNGTCVAPTKRLIAAGAPKCSRFVAVTTITRANLAAGVRSLTFSGRNRVPGVYRLTVTVRAGGQVSLPRTTTVTVKP